VALLDMSSYGLDDGMRLAGQLRHEVRDLPIVLVAAAPNPQLAIEAMRIGVMDCLHRSVSGDELCEAVDRAVRWRRDVRRARDTRERWTALMTERTSAIVQSCVETGIGSSMALEAWLTALYRRDEWTAAHVRRVARLSTLIGVMLGLDQATLRCLERAALLHDIGKLAVPDEIIAKPGPITADERKLMRAHVRVGFEIASSIPFLTPSADVVLSVRERYDGRGYPRGLRGKEIPIGARVVAVAEAFDAIGAMRTTEQPVAVAVANAEIARGAGSYFDPDVVRAWLQCVDSGVFGLGAGDDGGSP
jgi:putative nucleotidyltransferase with HDIG domain